MRRLSTSLTAFITISVLSTLVLASCKKGGTRRQSDLARWVDAPTAGTKDGTVIQIPDLGVKFEIPDTLYVYKECKEVPHTPNAEKWVPVVKCSSTKVDAFGEEGGAGSGAEPIDLTFFVTHKTRPLDERAVSWFENQYKQAGLDVADISYQADYQKKSGIYTKLHILEESSGSPTREIVQFLFPRQDVVFIARMEYPFGDGRATEEDWQYILWNFDFVPETAD